MPAMGDIRITAPPPPPIVHMQTQNHFQNVPVNNDAKPVSNLEATLTTPRWGPLQTLGLQFLIKKYKGSKW